MSYKRTSVELRSSRIVSEQSGIYVYSRWHDTGGWALCTRRPQVFERKTIAGTAAFRRACECWRQARRIRPRRFFFAGQTHGTGVTVLSPRQVAMAPSNRAGIIPGCDGLVTDMPDVAVGILTADCLPVFIYSPFRRVAAVIHAGWRGTHAGILEKTLQLFRERFGCAPVHLQLFLGPSIRDCCYQVGKEFIRYFPLSTVQRRDMLFFDLVGENIRQALAFGLLPPQILDSGVCTSCCRDQFFSYRRGDGESRILNSMVISPNKYRETLDTVH